MRCLFRVSSQTYIHMTHLMFIIYIVCVFFCYEPVPTLYCSFCLPDSHTSFGFYFIFVRRSVRSAYFCRFVLLMFVVSLRTHLSTVFCFAFSSYAIYFVDFIYYLYVVPPGLHSFPSRRSSYLMRGWFVLLAYLVRRLPLVCLL